jgi:hypothetical protein
MRRRIGEGRAGGGCRQSGDIDVVLHGNRNAVQRKLRALLGGQAFRLRQRFLFVAQADEDRGIVVIANAGKAARDGLRRRKDSGAVRGDNRGDGFSHAPLRLDENLFGRRGKLYLRMSNRKGRQGSPWPAFQEAGIPPDRSKRCAIVYTAGERSVYEIAFVLSDA